MRWLASGPLERVERDSGTDARFPAHGSGRCLEGKIRWRIPDLGCDILVNMSDTDLQLLARYARHETEDAFVEIVRLHLATWATFSSCRRAPALTSTRCPAMFAA